MKDIYWEDAVQRYIATVIEEFKKEIMSGKEYMPRVIY